MSTLGLGSDQLGPDQARIARPRRPIASGSTHASRKGDGNAEKQKTLDRSLLYQLRAVFEELLNSVYERPAKDAERKAKLKGAAESLGKS